jgi:hypothetical protein
MLFFAGKAISHFGEGIKDILNKEVGEDEEDEYAKIQAETAKKTIVLDLD